MHIFFLLVSLDKVVEVRCGQQTRNFIKFPYTEVESQSFSLIFEKDQGRILPHSNYSTNICVQHSNKQN